MVKLFLSFALLFSSIIYGQNRKSVELTLMGRHDKHADYTTRFSEINANAKLEGNSYGFNINYNQPVFKNLKIVAGAGYYNLGVDKILYKAVYDPLVRSRPTEYVQPDSTKPLVSSNKYHYDNINFNLGFFYERVLFRKWNIITGADLSCLYTFSQVYYIPWNLINYKTHESRLLGFGVNAYAGVVKKMIHEGYYISPKIIIPVYQKLNGDEFFGNDIDYNMKKWFNGYGVSVSFGKYF